MNLYFKRVINTHELLQEVKYLEGLIDRTSTGDAKPFRKKPLSELGLYKKHFMDASFIPQNIIAHFGYKYGGNSNLDTLLKKAFSKSKDIAELGKYLAHESTISAVDIRAKKRLTGEWVVFQKYGEKNYYLTLALHDEGDENIYKRVMTCYDFDYKFLRAS